MKMYIKLLVTMVISFIVMYTVMFLNVIHISHVYLSTTRLYMSILMVAPMAIIMVTMMRKMYADKKLNTAIIIGSILVFTAALFALRKQALISDESYLKAMIPHHSSAILTSRYADIQDPEVKELAKQIIESQEKEIIQMKAVLERMKNGKDN